MARGDSLARATHVLRLVATAVICVAAMSDMAEGMAGESVRAQN